MTEGQIRGAELRARREELGLTVEAVYRELRIPISCLQAIEEGDMRRLPASCYVKGFLKTYCALLGVPYQPYVHVLDGVQPAAGGFLRRRVMTRGRAGRGLPTPAWLTEVSAWAAICGLCLFGWLAYSALLQPSVDAERDRVNAGVVEVAPPPMPPAFDR